MNTKNPYIIPIIILILLALFAFGYYYNQKQKDNSVETKGGNISVDVKGEKNTENTISTEQYIAKISEIRKPVNAKIEEILPKIKYKTLFEQNEIISQTEETIQIMNNGITELEKINISKNLQDANKKEIESLKNLKEAMEALIASSKATDNKEKQKQSELVNYKIEESNRILKEITFPNTTSSGSSSNSSSTNSIDILQ